MTRTPRTMDRRTFLRMGALGAAAVGAGALLPGALGSTIRKAAAVAPAGSGSLQDIEHIVVLMQENRSFDHYFGTYPGARGFDDAPDAILHQPGWNANPSGKLYPYHLVTRQLENDAWCTNDISHEWDVQHRGWNAGAMDAQLAAHLDANGAAIGPACMGYYNGRDLAYYHALASAFTLLDGYHCSVLGPTDPNRLVAMTGTLDPDGRNGGPVLYTHLSDREKMLGTLTWKTMPEVLQDAGVSWKFYQTPDGMFGDNVLPYFKSYQDPTSELFRRGVAPVFPADLLADIASGNLPHVSWALASLVQSEHPGAPPPYGEMAVHQVLSALVANPEVWKKTVLLVTYDENGGFFDHVAPPTPPPGTPGEWLTVSPLPPEANGIAGPVGLGYRVPAIVCSPFARGGRIVSDTFDHTSVLQLIAKRFGVEVPNVSAWRRAAVGDLTTAFSFASPDPRVPWLPAPNPANPATLRQCAANAALGTEDQGQTYPVPTGDKRPGQGGAWEWGA